MPQPSTIRKAIEAGAGVVVIGVLEYVTESTDAATWLEQLVPAPLVPLVPVLLGGLTLTYRVWHYANTPASEDADSVAAPAPTGSQLATPSGPAPAPAAPAATPPAAYDAATDAAGALDAPALPDLRDPAAVQAVAASLAPLEAPAPIDPPTSFIPLPTR